MIMFHYELLWKYVCAKTIISVKERNVLRKLIVGPSRRKEDIQLTDLSVLSLSHAIFKYVHNGKEWEKQFCPQKVATEPNSFPQNCDN